MVNRTFLARTAAAAMFGALLPAAAGPDANLVEAAYARAWRNAGAEGIYVTPTPEQLVAARAVFVHLLRGQPAEAVAARARELGWELRSQPREGGVLTVLAEAADHRTGQGLYAFFTGGRHALQAPHVPTDGLTGEILLRYAEDGLARALAWNTAHRRVADLAHLQGSYLIAFSLAFAEVHPREKILQFHGFDAERRRSDAGAASGAIVSASHGHPSAELRAAVQCLQRRVEPHTRLYGVDVRELGGTTNTVARALHAERFDRFVHLEAAMPLRRRLLDDPVQRRTLFDCLGGKG